jgi:hypothetical protein
MIFYGIYFSMLICVLINNSEYLNDHILLSAFAKQILFRYTFVDVLVTPNFKFSFLADVKHVLKYFEISVAAVEYFKAL